MPPWNGEPRLPLLGDRVAVQASGWRPKGGWPARIGSLTPLGALRLSARDPAFGASPRWSRTGRADAAGRRRHVRADRDPGLDADHIGKRQPARGCGTGWQKSDRDSELLAIDPATGRLWVGFERANAIWRFAPGFARWQRRATPRAMRRWGQNSGAESLVRLHDGRFLVIPEGSGRRNEPRRALLFAGDPTASRARAAAFRYRPPPGYAPSDAAVLPGGDVLVLNRRFRLPLVFTASWSASQPPRSGPAAPRTPWNAGA
ncbi:esterase-like activity of phytase family protein [Sphingomonas sp. MMS24-JH45]